jgi:hypothetical protein
VVNLCSMLSACCENINLHVKECCAWMCAEKCVQSMKLILMWFGKRTKSYLRQILSWYFITRGLFFKLIHFLKWEFWSSFCCLIISGCGTFLCQLKTHFKLISFYFSIFKSSLLISFFWIFPSDPALGHFFPHQFPFINCRSDLLVWTCVRSIQIFHKLYFIFILIIFFFFHFRYVQVMKCNVL